MSSTGQARIHRLAHSGIQDLFCGGLRGIEKESLRITEDGRLSLRPHPEALGSALTNRFITTDFSEALLEFVTPALTTSRDVLSVLCEIHQFTYDNLDDELLWVNSMPCVIGNDDEIPLAKYGMSNIGQMKTVYRNGLGYRYGRKMQTIAGVHFNYSLPERFWHYYHDIECSRESLTDFRSAAYMGLARNFRRFGWLVLYLTGSSPAVCKSFLGAQGAGLQSLDAKTYYLPNACSLRMSDLGYSNSTQAGLRVSLNSLDEYIKDLTEAICTPEQEYQKIGVKVDGQYRQLNANKLQIENEFYSSIRPKRTAYSGERPTTSLRNRGVEYVEIRSLDTSVMDPAGISQNTMRFMEAFSIYCLLHDSPAFSEGSYAETLRNHDVTAKNGRDAKQKLLRNDRQILLRDWAKEIMDDVMIIAELIDQADENGAYTVAVEEMRCRVLDSELTPSAQILSKVREESLGFFEFGMQMAEQHRDYFLALNPLDESRYRRYANEATESLSHQRQIESEDKLSFDDYLEKYFSKSGCAR